MALQPDISLARLQEVRHKSGHDIKQLCVGFLPRCTLLNDFRGARGTNSAATVNPHTLLSMLRQLIDDVFLGYLDAEFHFQFRLTKLFKGSVQTLAISLTKQQKIHFP